MSEVKTQAAVFVVETNKAVVNGKSTTIKPKSRWGKVGVCTTRTLTFVVLDPLSYRLLVHATRERGARVNTYFFFYFCV